MSLEDFVHTLSKPRALGMMVPAAAVDQVLKAVVPLLQPGETDFGDTLSALRYQSGGHEEKAAS